ncbi:hypothetical protein Sliba_77500 [Streptomyces nigrescens]|uniref:Uncharacterized protein n=1 Tax=Streptomyces nigrescens TaxID=1920 RepID=A0A640TUG0_STRNI|nr:hypothetical protein Sliba_77500 [Streptomyces libani subsp. libani]GGV96536.1 hypothetical protein GCM10010500_39570 [Streptomyces libani subsp. libani]
MSRHLSLDRGDERHRRQGRFRAAKGVRESRHMLIALERGQVQRAYHRMVVTVLPPDQRFRATWNCSGVICGHGRESRGHHTIHAIQFRTADPHLLRRRLRPAGALAQRHPATSIARFAS